MAAPCAARAGSCVGPADRCVHRRHCTGRDRTTGHVAPVAASAAMNAGIGVLRSGHGNSRARPGARPTRRYSTSSSTSVSECSETKAIGTTSTATLVMRGPLDLRFGARLDPVLRRGTRLVADRPVEAHAPHAATHARHGLLDLPLVRVATADDHLRQAVRREQHAQADRSDRAAPWPRRSAVRNSADRGGDIGLHRSDSSTATVVRPPARRVPRPRASRSANCRSWWWNTADTAAAARPRPAASRAPPAPSSSLNGCQ